MAQPVERLRTAQREADIAGQGLQVQFAGPDATLAVWRPAANNSSTSDRRRPPVACRRTMAF